MVKPFSPAARSRSAALSGLAGEVAGGDVIGDMDFGAGFARVPAVRVLSAGVATFTSLRERLEAWYARASATRSEIHRHRRAWTQCVYDECPLPWRRKDLRHPARGTVAAALGNPLAEARDQPAAQSRRFAPRESRSLRRDRAVLQIASLARRQELKAEPTAARSGAAAGGFKG
jgi:hypothetical protein